MNKKERGILTIEASIVLVFSTLFILFLLGFARIYSAQSVVSHAVIQSADSLALESYLRETALTGSEADIVALANRLTGSTDISADSFTSLRSAYVPKIAEEKFIYALSDSKENADEKLKRLGVKDGLSGIDFSACKVDLGKDDVIVSISYTLKLQFPVFGMSEIKVTKSARSKTFGDILFAINVISENEHYGTAHGSGNYKYGTEVDISATPAYGYKFKEWSDGNTDNPRKIKVTEAKTYTAKFEQIEFGINLVASPSSGGTVSGGGTVMFMNSTQITATAFEGYSFSHWEIFGHANEAYTRHNTSTTTITADQSYTCTAHFKPNEYIIKVKTEGIGNSPARILYGNRDYLELKLNYGDSFALNAPQINRYTFLGWKEEGGSNYFSTSLITHLSVTAKSTTYVACFESNIKKVTFYGYGGIAQKDVWRVVEVESGSTLYGKMPINPQKDGQVFQRWENFDASTVVRTDMHIQSVWSTCVVHRSASCGVVHRVIGWQREITPKGYIILSGGHDSYKTTHGCCKVCADCGALLTVEPNRIATTFNYCRLDDNTILKFKVMYCYTHKNGKSGGCEESMNRASWTNKRIFRIHSDNSREDPNG